MLKCITVLHYGWRGFTTPQVHGRLLGRAVCRSRWRNQVLDIEVPSRNSSWKMTCSWSSLHLPRQAHPVEQDTHVWPHVASDAQCFLHCRSLSVSPYQHAQLPSTSTQNITHCQYEQTNYTFRLTSYSCVSGPANAPSQWHLSGFGVFIFASNTPPSLLPTSQQGSGRCQSAGVPSILVVMAKW